MCYRGRENLRHESGRPELEPEDQKHTHARIPGEDRAHGSMSGLGDLITPCAPEGMQGRPPFAASRAPGGQHADQSAAPIPEINHQFGDLKVLGER